jgi:hypothetical protein
VPKSVAFESIGDDATGAVFNKGGRNVYVGTGAQIVTLSGSVIPSYSDDSVENHAGSAMQKEHTLYETQNSSNVIMYITTDSTKDAYTEVAVLSGASCTKITAINRYAYFKVKPGYLDPSDHGVTITFDYYDSGLEQLALHGLRQRVIHLLSTLSAKFGVIQDGYALIDLPLSHQEIANMLGASREAVSGLMGELAKEGVVKVSRMSVQLVVTILEENVP